MKKFFILFATLLALVTVPTLTAESPTLTGLSTKYKLNEGFVGQLYDSENDKFYLRIDNIGQDFIYQTSLPQGLGSNDIGLDRGQLHAVRLVSFRRIGNNLHLVQKNTAYRAVSNNKEESESVAQAFASAILWAFPIVDSGDNWVLVDASDFILQDSHGVSTRLAQSNQGNFSLDKSRSAIYLERTKSFPDNTEIEASVTFTGKDPGNFVRQAAIDPNILSLRMHHSFIRLPKAGYKPRVFHPKSGFWMFGYSDYAQAINKPVTQRFIPRHRLEKKNPNAAVSEAVEPIIYYLDPGAPEPVKTALITGGMWWNQAFEAIGYKDAFQIKILPDNADPMDVRYNVIQWVHRATRGWSYGYGVTDPRNGEIIKGHVSLGSLRVRQDYLIAQGMLSRFADVEDDHELMDLALARIQQLSAHEIGHTLGLAHNFAASTYDRGSVMDYPHPLFEMQGSKIVANNAYAKNIGVWDKTAIAYGYQTFSEGQESTELVKILENNGQNGLLFISDPDSRRIGDAHPQASLWDNGKNTINELERVFVLRANALAKFGDASLHSDRPLSDLEEILMPVFYFHRYQATAASKWIGGVDYDYATKNSNDSSRVLPADSEQQEKALMSLIKTFDPVFLSIGNTLTQKLFPKAMGYQRSRESLVGNSGVTFDPVALAAASSQHTLSLLLNPSRLVRLQQQNSVDSKYLGIADVVQSLHENVIDKNYQNTQALIHQTTIDLIYSNYINLIHNADVPTHVKAEIYGLLKQQISYLEKKLKKRKISVKYFNFYTYQLQRLKAVEPKNLKQEEQIKLPQMPPGSPI